MQPKEAIQSIERILDACRARSQAALAALEQEDWDAFDQARLFILRLAGEAAMDFIEGNFGQESDAVPALLSMSFNVVA